MINELIKSLANLLTWVVLVAPWEQALRIRLGKSVRLLGPGFYLRIPLVDRVYRQSVRKRLVVVRPQVLTTTDQKSVSIGGCISYEIEDLRRLFDTLEDAEDSIETEANTKVAGFISSRSFLECNIKDLEAHVASQLDLKQYGLRGSGFMVTSFVMAKTYRIITGDLPAWSRGWGLTLTTELGVKE